ncbi:MAG TPA: acyl dehydratase [Ferrovibrio sp.]|uniref:acyl dehydratase n=1 Tax=Ferrovibrio sp. TaxID=1917215 RepID=UPI002ED32736
MHIIGRGFIWDDLQIGFQFRTAARTITEADLVNFVGVSWMNEELFTDASGQESRAIRGRVVPGVMVYAIAEGLLTPSMQETGLAFLNAEVDVKGPTCVGDTIHVECEVIEMRPTSKPDRGLVRTMNKVITQAGVVTLTYNPLRMMRRRQG